MGSPLSPGLVCGLARRPRIMGVGGAASRTHLRAGPWPWQPAASAPSRWQGHVACYARPAPPKTTRCPEARAGVPCFPFSNTPILPRSAAPTARPAPPARFPGCPVGWGSPRHKAESVLCTSAPCLCALPPALAVKPSGLPWKVLGSHTPRRGEGTEPVLGIQRSSGYSQHPPAFPDASVILLSAPLGTLAVGSDIIFPSWKPIMAPGNLQPPGTRQIEDTCTVQSSTYPGASLVLGNFSKSVSFLIKGKMLLSVPKNGLENEYGVEGMSGEKVQKSVV